MKEISEKEVSRKIQLENPWWGEDESIDEYFRNMKPRAYLELFYKLVLEKGIHRAVVLMGPRRVGKTVMIYHAVQRLIDEGVDPKKICYVSMEAPVYTGLGLEQMVGYYSEVSGLKNLKGCYIFFDEIQYLRNWEVHLKKLVDDYRGVKFIASGSAAAALKLKSAESGAGRFTNFLLPPLTFYEYLSLLGREKLAVANTEDTLSLYLPDYHANDIGRLNKEFVNYMNFGGYPEALFSEAIKADPGRYIRSDIIDKVLMRDLPSLYGIQDLQELNRLFTVLAYNTGNEVSLDELSKNSGVAKNTIKKYLEYLEAAFLITILHRVDQSGKRFKRANYFKVYLTNPSIRCALFEPVTETSEAIGNLVETAIISQWLHSVHMNNLFYSRWDKGEVDMVMIANSKPVGCGEIKWSNRFFDNPHELKSLLSFMEKNELRNALVTTIDENGVKKVGQFSIEFIETSMHCYRLGRNNIRGKAASASP